jgi:hypothetical protein
VGKTTLALAIGAEIDLLLERPDGELWGIEIKRGLSAKPQRGFHHAIADLEPARALLLHAGNDRYPISEGIEAIGLRLLAEELSSAG